jgi:hypothetical protein
MLRGAGWQFVTDVSALRIGSVFDGQAIEDVILLGLTEQHRNPNISIGNWLTD